MYVFTKFAVFKVAAKYSEIMSMEMNASHLKESVSVRIPVCVMNSFMLINCNVYIHILINFKLK